MQLNPKAKAFRLKCISQLFQLGSKIPTTTVAPIPHFNQSIPIISNLTVVPLIELEEFIAEKSKNTECSPKYLRKQSPSEFYLFHS